MLANPDTACRVDAQSKGGTGSGSGVANSGDWKGKGQPGAHTANQDGSGGGGAVRKGGDGTAPKTLLLKNVPFVLVSILSCFIVSILSKKKSKIDLPWF